MLFCQYIVVYGGIKRQLITAMEPVLISQIKDHLKGFGQVMVLEMMDHLFSSYGDIEKKPRRKHSQDNGSIQPRGTPCLPHIGAVERERI